MKVYVQNGFNKQILTAPNYKQAVTKFFKILTKPGKNGDELFELSPITFVSQCGFIEDIKAVDMKKEFDEIKMFRTAKVFDNMGRKDIGKYLRKQEKTMPKAVRELAESL